MIAIPKNFTQIALRFSYLLLLGVVLLCIRMQCFMSYAEYDDEGTLLFGYQNYIDGHVFFSESASVYGIFQNFFYKFSSLPFFDELTHSLIRELVAIQWFSIVIMISVIVFHGSRSYGLMILGVSIAYFRLMRLQVEPGATQSVILMVMFLCFTMTTFFSRVSTMLMGVMTALLFHIKINLGLFVFVASLVDMCLNKDSLRFKTLKWSSLMLPIVLMFRVGHAVLVVPLLLLAFGGIFSLFQVLEVSVQNFQKDGLFSKEFKRFAATYVAVWSLVMAFAFFEGCDISGLWFGIFAQHLNVTEVIVQSLHFDVYHFFLMVFPCVMLWGFLGKSSERRNILLGWARLSAVLFVAMTVVGDNSTESILIHSFPFLPLYLLDKKLFSNKSLRSMLVFSVFLIMINYPVVGSNLIIVTTLMIPLVLVFLNNSLDECWLKTPLLTLPIHWAELVLFLMIMISLGSVYLCMLSMLIYGLGLLWRSVSFRVWIGCLFFLSAMHACTTVISLLSYVLILGAVFFLQKSYVQKLMFGGAILVALYVVGVSYIESEDTYELRSDLNVIGGERIRLPIGQSKVIEDVCAEIMKAKPDYLFSCPGLLSFNLWTGVDSPTKFAVGMWPYVYSYFDTDKRRQVIEMMEENQVMVLWNERQFQFWGDIEKIENDILISYMKLYYHVKKKIGDYEILVPNRSVESD